MILGQSNRVSLDLNKLGITSTLSEFSFQPAPTCNALVAQLITYVAGEKQEPYTYTQPANRWSMFKLAVLPGWLLKRWPAKLTVITLNIRTLYPKLKTKLPRDLMGEQVSVFIKDTNIGSFLAETDGLTQARWNEKVEAILMSKQYVDQHKCPRCGRLWNI